MYFYRSLSTRLEQVKTNVYHMKQSSFVCTRTNQSLREDRVIKKVIIHRSSHEYRGYIVRQAPFFENRIINIIVNAQIKTIFERCFRCS